ncbi:MAG: peptide chain release factor N(5)-glutamine methyltransferase [Bacteroidota bacterium]
MNTYPVKKLIQVFKSELFTYYPENEIMQILYILFEAFMGWPKTKVHLSFDSEIPENEMRAFKHALDELKSGKPIQYILGRTVFNGSKLIVNESVLVPRPETEELCLIIKSDHRLKPYHKFSILDIGTGSGCISIDLKRYFPDSSVTGIDSSPAAIEIAKTNAGNNGCEISFIKSDILNDDDNLKLALFDVIVSNPPYVLESEKQFMHRNVIDFEPESALFVPDNNPLLYYRAIADFAREHLTPQGLLFFEINEKYGEDICRLLLSFGFEKAEVLIDINGKDRFVRAISSEGFFVRGHQK